MPKRHHKLSQSKFVTEARKQEKALRKAKRKSVAVVPVMSKDEIGLEVRFDLLEDRLNLLPLAREIAFPEGFDFNPGSLRVIEPGAVFEGAS